MDSFLFPCSEREGKSCKVMLSTPTTNSSLPQYFYFFLLIFLHKLEEWRREFDGEGKEKQNKSSQLKFLSFFFTSFPIHPFIYVCMLNVMLGLEWEKDRIGT